MDDKDKLILKLGERVKGQVELLSRRAEKMTINDHEGKKYLRTIRSATAPVCSIEVDVYCVLKAFEVTDPIVSHAVKKLLCLGKRGKGDRMSDLKGAQAAISRAIEEEQRDGENVDSR